MMTKLRLRAFLLASFAAVFASGVFAQVTLNGGAGSIPTTGASTPYPSNIVVAGTTGTISGVTVTINSMNHTWTDDIDIVLVGPNSNNIILMNDCCGNGDLINTTITFSDAAATLVPTAATNLPSGSYRPTINAAGAANNGAPCPAPSALTTLASAFNGASANGTWSLYVWDDTNGDLGSWTAWSITINGVTLPGPEINVQQPAGTNRSSGATMNIGSVQSGVQTVRTFTVQNLGSTNNLDVTSVGAAPTGVANCTANTTALAPASPVTPLGSATFDLQLTPTAGGAFECTVTIANNDSDEGTYTIVVQGNSIAYVNSLPFSTSFETTPTNMSTQATGTFPTATAAGTTVGSIAQAGTAQIQFAGTLDGLAPPTGTVQAGIDFPAGQATGAIDLYFNLTAYNAATDVLMLRFRSACRSDDDQNTDNVFLSLDGGVTWSLSLFNFVQAGSDQPYVLNTVNVSAALVAATLNYTNSVVIRLQVGDNVAFAGNDGMLFDDVSLGRDPEIDVQRPASTSIPSASTDNVGAVSTTTGASFTYTIANLGDLDLNLTGVAPNYVVVTPGTGAPAVSVTTQPTTPVTGGSGVTFTVLVTPAAAGAFDFQISIANNDTSGGEDPYLITVSGTGFTNAPPVLALATSTDFVAGSDFDLTVAPGASLAGTNGAVLTASDATPDPVDATITFTTGPQGTTPPTGITQPADVVAGAGAGFNLSWTGTADASNDPGTYEWNVELDDGVSVVNFTVRIIITNAAPAHVVVAPTTGDGSLATPYARNNNIGAVVAFDIATVSDANTGQNVSIFSQTNTANPAGSSATFAFTLNPAAGNPATLICTPSASALIDVGDFDYTIVIEDDSTPTPVQTTLYVTITVVGTAPTITSAAAPTTAVVGVSYSHTFTMTGNPTPTISLTAGTLPGWLTLVAGVLSGTPAIGDVGTVGPLTFTATNGIAPDDTEVVTITVSAGTAPTITSTAVTTATELTAYTYTFTMTGNPTPTLSLTTGTLPAWLTLVGNTLSGTPPAGSAGTYGPFTFTATNGVAPDATQAFSITVSSSGGGGGGGGGGGDDGGCSTGESNSLWMLAGALAAFALALRLRRKLA